jgi:DNA polymerase-3 subunit beta
MKILCDRLQLNDAFALVAAIAPTKSPKAVLQQILLVAEADQLTLYATDLEMSARVVLDSVKVDKPGRVLLPAREATALLCEITDPTVTLVAKEQRCTITSGGGSFVLLGEDPEQFPQITDVAPDERSVAVRLSGGRLVEMIRQTGFAAAREESRYAIHGVLFDLRPEMLRLVATDGRRLALVYQNLGDGDLTGRPENGVVVPARALQAIARSIPEGSNDPVTIRFAATQVGFEYGGVHLLSRLLDCRFPDYEAVVPRAADTTIELNREVLGSSLRKVAILSAGDMRMVRFHFQPGALELSAESQSGRADVSMDADVKGAGGAITFNPDYVLDALKVAELETIRIDMSDDSTPAKFQLGEAFTYVLMPIGG